MNKYSYKEGDIIGAYTFVSYLPNRGKSKSKRGIVRCRCGKEIDIKLDSARDGGSRSCGCMASQFISEAGTKHGHATGGKSPEYGSWQAMWRRCTNPKHQNYERYKSLGITVCDEWITFKGFIDDMGLRPTPQHTIDRKNNTKGYCKDNCRWATKTEQQRNKRDTVYLEYNGERKPLYDWAETFKINPRTLYSRVHVQKWDTKLALETSVNHKNNLK